VNSRRNRYFRVHDILRRLLGLRSYTPKIVTGGLNIVALRWWIRLKARRRFRKALGAPQSAKIHRPKIKNSHSGNHKNRAERRLHVSHQVKNRTQYLHSYVCLLAVVIDFLRCWTVRAPRQTI
jgi:hypothetical protein